MGDVHVIRLRAPWDQVSADELPPDLRGGSAYLRRFGRPTGIGPDEAVWLVLDGAAAGLRVFLNGEVIVLCAGNLGVQEFELPRTLPERNRLLLVLPRDSEQQQQNARELPVSFAAAVRLEMRPA